MIILNKTETGFAAKIQLSNGTEAGEGYGYDQDGAIYWAIQDCLKSDDSRFQTIGNFYRRMYYPTDND